MRVSQYIVDSLINKGVTDVFGIPGGVVLDLLYAIDSASPKIIPHLMCHEQNAGFAACGYAQASGKLGVAYVTKGPGFTNVITAIAEAYYESIPVLFITAHSSNIVDGIRTMSDQEMDTCSMVKNITKCAKRLDIIEKFCIDFEEAINIALTGRKGPILLDISDKILNSDITNYNVEKENSFSHNNLRKSILEISNTISKSRRPIILFGDGIIQALAEKHFKELVQKINIPTISSRATHYLLADEKNYMGYIGSHGIRSANFVLSKSDLIVSIGNRMHYPILSETYKKALKNTKVLRIDIDAEEFKRIIPNSKTYNLDAKNIILSLLSEQLEYGEHLEWNNICHYIKTKLNDIDIEQPIPTIASILNKIPSNAIIVSDVGNHEFLLSKAAVWINLTNHTIYSKSFGALGNAIGKAIGAYYASRNSVICFIGDQGFQMCCQELHFIQNNRLPITIVILNNEKSGMIFDREIKRYNYAVHTTKESGYNIINCKEIANAYRFDFKSNIDDVNFNNPTILELKYVEESIPYIPQGNECQNMYPYISEELYKRLNLL